MFAKQKWAQFTVARTLTKRNAASVPIGKIERWRLRFDWKDLVSIVTPRTVITEEMMAMIIATTVVIR